MKIAKWFYFGVPVLIGVGMLLASQPKDKRLPPRGRIDFDHGTKYRGRELTSAETTTVGRAIDSIGKSPPDSITYKDAAGSTHTVSCSTIAAGLRKQLKRGDIEAETLNTGIYGAVLPDGKETTEGDEMNLKPDLIGKATGDSTKLKHLEEVLLHEYIHKTQDRSGLDSSSKAREIEALAAELAYKDSIGLDTSDRLYRITRLDYEKRKKDYATGEKKKPSHAPKKAKDSYAFLQYDTTGTGTDIFTSFEIGDMEWYEYDLGSTRASDMMIFEDYFLFPPEHCLALICGGGPMPWWARILTLDIYEGEVVTEYTVQDFSGMFFYSMTRWPETGFYYLLDTLNQEIVTMVDINDDLIPDTVVTTYASAFWPEFGPLWGMRGVDATTHPYYGAFGLIINHDDAHIHHEIDLYDYYWFLPDWDGNDTADACFEVPVYEFVTFKPHIQVPLPIEGDDFVQIFASWNHDIEVYATDSLGEILYEQLGTVAMFDGVDAECPLYRPLVEGEFVLSIDAGTGARLNLATKVGSFAPKNLTIHLETFEIPMLYLRWDEVPGADHYLIFESEDPMDFTGATTHISMTNEFTLPLPYGEKWFYQVKAVR